LRFFHGLITFHFSAGSWHPDGDRGILVFSPSVMITGSRAGVSQRAGCNTPSLPLSAAPRWFVPVPTFGWWAARCFLRVANGVISPMQKSLLTQNAPAELRGGIVSFDRLIQQVSNTTSTSIVGLLLVSASLSTIFWFLGILSFISVGLMACLLPKPKAVVSTESVS
jgi:hypothetical protein